MSKFLQLAAGLSCLGGLVLAVVALQPAHQLLPIFQGCMAALMSPPAAKERPELHDQIGDEHYYRRIAKWQMAQEVIAGRLSLADAMQRLHARDQGLPADLIRTPEAFEMSDDERNGQAVIFYVQRVLKLRPGEENPVVGRLEKELQELLASRQKRPAALPEPRTAERSR